MKIEIPKGLNIYKATEIAKEYAKACRCDTVTFEFNGIDLAVHADSNLSDSVSIYWLKCEIRSLNR